MEDLSYLTDCCFSSDSMRSDGSLSLAELSTRAENALHEETTNSNHDAAEAVSSSGAQEEQVCASRAAEEASHVEKPKKKAWVVFSDQQLNILHHRFSLHPQLKPCEMKELAETTQLTYKQVKTWFQNRRMKLKRRNKVTWCSETQSLNNGVPLHGLSNNIPPHVPHFQGARWPPHWEQFNQERNFRTVAPQNQAPYLTAAAPASQSTVPNWPQKVNWSMPPSSSHHQYSPSAFNPALNVKALPTAGARCDEQGWV